MELLVILFILKLYARVNIFILFQRDHNGNKAMLIFFLCHPNHKKVFVKNIL